MTDDVEAMIARVLLRWRGLGVDLMPPPSPDQIRRFEDRHEVSFPGDMKAFLSMTGGMETNDWDEHEIRFWGLDEMVPLGQEVPTLAATHEGYWVFADFLISSHYYAVCLGRNAPNHIARASSGEMEILCASFSEFLRIYLDSPDSLF
jgi:hypothetical protein